MSATPTFGTNGVLSTQRLVAAGPLALALAGMLLLAKGLYLPVKAEVAQWLLERAWVSSATDGGEVRPWAWADTWPVARLLTPYAEHIVLAGTHGEALAFGPGWDPRGVAPGELGNLILAGHRDTHFAALQHLRTGERISVETTSGERKQYLVTFTGVTHRNVSWPLEPTQDDVLTLITCYPFSRLAPGGPLRWIVRAQVTPS